MGAGAQASQGGSAMDREDPSDPAADDTEIPAGWATVRALAVQRGVSMGTVRRHYGEYKSIPFRRLADGRIIVNAAAIPKDHFKRTHRHREMMDDVRREIEQAASDSSYSAEEYSAVQVIRRHVRWLEQTVEELQGRHAEYERERRRMEQAHRAERQQLLGIVASLTGAAPTPDAEPALRPRRPRRKAPEVG